MEVVWWVMTSPAFTRHVFPTARSEATSTIGIIWFTVIKGPPQSVRLQAWKYSPLSRMCTQSLAEGRTPFSPWHTWVEKAIFGHFFVVFALVESLSPTRWSRAYRGASPTRHSLKGGPIGALINVTQPGPRGLGSSRYTIITQEMLFVIWFHR